MNGHREQGRAELLADSNEISIIANQIAERLKDAGMVVHRYDARTSNSVYLKLDYGACYTLRISDHQGNNKLHYRYNLLLCSKGKRKKRNGNKHYSVYGRDSVRRLISDIIKCRVLMIRKYGINWYDKRTKNFKAQSESTESLNRGFWRGARII